MEQQHAFDRLNAMEWPAAVTKPDFTRDFSLFEVESTEHRRRLSEFGIHAATMGGGNVVLLANDFEKLAAAVHLNFNGSNNVMAIEARSALRGHLRFGSENVVAIGGQQHALALAVEMYAGGALIWGRGARTYGCRIWVHGGKRVVVGDDCLFSEAIQIRTSDHHSVIDLDTYEQANFPEDVLIGRHVWIGPGVSILKGVRIGKGAIVAAGSMLVRSVASGELWGGAPARLIRRRVSWVDRHPSDQQSIAQLRKLMESDD